MVDEVKVKIAAVEATLWTRLRTIALQRRTPVKNVLRDAISQYVNRYEGKALDSAREKTT